MREGTHGGRGPLPLASEGIPFLLLSLGATLAAAVYGQHGLTIPLLLLTLFVAYFFRDPDRVASPGPGLVASPADGKVIAVGVVNEPEFQLGSRHRISIFMSLFDVHVNRVPVDGTVRDIRYHRGKFLAAYDEDASELNERNAVLFETGDGQKVVVVQVAGLVARRIRFYPVLGALVLKGQRMGIIRFGSRCDVYLPLDAQLGVKLGDVVRGGESVLACLKGAE